MKDKEENSNESKSNDSEENKINIIEDLLKNTEIFSNAEELDNFVLNECKKNNFE